jgi:hypothetical protein
VQVLLLLIALVCAGCSTPPRAAGVYARDTRALIRLDYDYDGNGVIDVRTYVRNGKPVRLEGDTNGDGVIDRWEYYGASGELLRIGASSQDDGCQDTWVRTAGDERYVDVSTRRDGRIDRREVYRTDQLVRAESDTNHDGLTDMWEEFNDGAVKVLLVDEKKRHGRPTKRIVYGAEGTARVEMLIGENANASR